MESHRRHRRSYHSDSFQGTMGELVVAFVAFSNCVVVWFHFGLGASCLGKTVHSLKLSPKFFLAALSKMRQVAAGNSGFVVRKH